MFGGMRAAVMAGVLALACGACGDTHTPARAVPAGYDAGYAETIAGAEREGALTIWSSTDIGAVSGLLAGFRRHHPTIAVHYADLPARDIDDRFRAESAAGKPNADLIWSSAMDLQIKLVNDGYAQSYVSPESGALPHWANWKNQAWGVTAEPVVMVYNRQKVAPGAAPASHLDFRRMLEAKGRVLDGRVATYDPVRSAAGYLYLSQDDEASRDIWRTVRALGANHVRLHPTSESVIADVSAGRATIGYNVVGSYAAEEMRRNPNLAVVLPSDYTLVMSRIAIIPARAPHPGAARLFLDYLLSREGQRHLAERSMRSVRSDVPAPASLRSAGIPLRAIRVGPALLVLQDTLTQRHFKRRWQQAIEAGGALGPAQSGP